MSDIFKFEDYGNDVIIGARSDVVKRGFSERTGKPWYIAQLERNKQQRAANGVKPRNFKRKIA